MMMMMMMMMMMILKMMMMRMMIMIMIIIIIIMITRQSCGIKRFTDRETADRADIIIKTKEEKR